MGQKMRLFHLLRVKGQTIISEKYKGQARDKTSQIWVKFKGQD